MKVQTCPKCNGGGKIFNRVDYNYENFTSSGVQIPCNLCGGFGYLIEKEYSKNFTSSGVQIPCNLCGGFGYLIEKEYLIEKHKDWIDINYLKPGCKVKEIVAKFSNGEKKIINLGKQNSLYGEWLSEDHKVIHITHWFELID